MTDIIDVQVPDVGEDEVEVIEVAVKVGDTVEPEDALIVVETDKASMDIPSPQGGTVSEVVVNVGDKVSQGSVIVKLSAPASPAEPVAASQGAPALAPAPAQPVAEPATAAEPAPAPVVESVETQVVGVEVIEVFVPDIGTSDEVDVIEILVSPGDNINQEDGLITLETDKATMDVPSPAAGEVKALKVQTGDKVQQGSLILMLEVSKTEEVKVVSPSSAIETKGAAPAPTKAAQPVKSEPQPPVPHHPMARGKAKGGIYSSPSVRRLAREFGVDLSQVTGSGRKGRILKEDVQAYVKYELSRPKATAAANVAGGGGGLQVIAPPKVDFAKFGEIEEKALSRIQKISGPNLHRNWVTIRM